MTWGVCVQTVRYAEAYLVLCKFGLSLEARAIARAAIEHAATAEYAYFYVDGLDKLAATADEGAWSLRDRLYRWLGDESFAPGEKPVRASKLPRLTADDGTGLLRAVDPDAALLDPGYAILSQGVHVTHETLSGFMVTNDEEPLGMQLLQHREDELAELTRHIVAQACMLVAYIEAHVLEDKMWLDELEFRSDMLGIPVRLDAAWAPDVRSHL